jgi:predicted acetyltransferase
VPVSLDAPAGLEAFLREVGAGEAGFGGTEFASGRLSLAGYLQMQVDFTAGLNLPDGYVPQTTFWGIDDHGEVIGMLRMRHRLNDVLLRSGGHIGYYVRPEARGKGYASEMLRLALLQAREMGIDRVLLTAYASNEASCRVIEKNGGIMEDESPHPETGLPYRRYWIEVAGRANLTP